jgi:hypothetical protein
MADPSTITTEIEAAALLASPLTPAERAELEQCMAAIREAAAADRAARLQIGEALSDLRHRNAHRQERDRRGRPISTEAGRWEAYLRRRHPEISKREAAALMAEFSAELVRCHHQGGTSEHFTPTNQ